MKTAVISLVCCLGSAGVHAQDVVPPIEASRPILIQEDLAVLEDRHPHNDFQCTAVVAPPTLGFDLKLHTEYQLSIPMHELAGSQPASLTVVFRITAEHSSAVPEIFLQNFRLPVMNSKAKGEVQLHVDFDVGEGSYRVDWLLRDQRWRVRSSHGFLHARLSGKDRQLKLAIGPGVIQASRGALFEEQQRSGTGPLHVKILVNFGPEGARSGILSESQKQVIVAILRTIAAEPGIGHFSLTAFNLRDERILYRQSDATQIDFPGLGTALQTRPAGTIDIHRLAVKHGPTEFLRGLMAQELQQSESTDAVILAGATAVLDHDIPTDSLRSMGNLPYPVFYLTYSENPYQDLFGDVISKAVRVLKGREYDIAYPRDVWFACRDIISRLSARGARALSAEAQ